ncbi:MAG TPA: AarF/UbiB family protein [Acidimicrobiales bacterium]|nr:AarF/UbiB family protein [Acidimicrobiales bacterium]
MIENAYRGPYADGPPPAALVVDAPDLTKIGLKDFFRLVAVECTIVWCVWAAVMAWIFRRHARRGRTVVRAACDGLVDAFERLGPTFVKAGQLITSSPGVFPAPLAQACKRCLDEVPPFPSEEVRRVIREDLGHDVEDIFAKFDDAPLASASIAQVHAVVLPDNTEAVLKIQRPGVRASMNSDLRNLYRIAKLVEHTKLGQRVQPTKFVEDMHVVSNQEVNCALEAHRQTQFRTNIDAFADNADITAPEVYWNYCGPRVICMERLYGVPIDSFDVFVRRGIDGETLLRKGMKVAFEAMLVHGPFHGDVHAGNIWLLDDGRAAFLDFGLMGELPEQWKSLMTDLLRTAQIDDNWARVVRNYKDVGVLSEDIGSDEEVGARLQMVMQPMFDMTASSVDLSEVFKQQIALAESMGAKAPQELMLVAKQVFYFERYVKGLAPNYRMIKDLYLTKNVIPESRAVAADRGVAFPS